MHYKKSPISNDELKKYTKKHQKHIKKEYKKLIKTIKSPDGSLPDVIIEDDPADEIITKRDVLMSYIIIFGGILLVSLCVLVVKMLST